MPASISTDSESKDETANPTEHPIPVTASLNHAHGELSSPDDDDAPPLITLSNHCSSSSSSPNPASGSGSGSGSTSPPGRMRPALPIPAKRASAQGSGMNMAGTLVRGGLSTIPNGQGLGKPSVPQKTFYDVEFERDEFGEWESEGVGQVAKCADETDQSDNTYEFNKPDQSDESSATYEDTAAEK
ncbi:hypothetical protein BJ165DRAFT_1409222 [Panaeolus papilionaceus]|nr:hypothetical protein BJ165DRAFT_1409222 [Panaeolus papilionaceus]